MRRRPVPPDESMGSDGAEATPLIDWAGRRQLSLYFGLAFLLSWAAWPLVALNPDSSPLVPFGPLLAAVMVCLVTGGWRRVAHLLAQLARWRALPSWYLLALAGPVAVTAAAGLLGALGGALPTLGDLPSAAMVVATFLSTVVLIGLFEELGWRGYALPQLQKTFSGLGSALLLGAIWALWHLPELVSDPTGQRPPLQFVLFVMAQSVVLAWLYTSTDGALPLVVIAHSATNTAAQFVLPLFGNQHYQLVWWWLAGLWVVAAALLAAATGVRLSSGRAICSK